MKNIEIPKEDLKYQKIIYKLAHRLPKNGRTSFEDLVNVGLMALHTARQSFNPNKKTKFSSYAYRVIKNAIYAEWSNNANNLKVKNSYKLSKTEEIKAVQEMNAKTLSLDYVDKNNDDQILFAGNVFEASNDVNPRRQKKNDMCSGVASSPVENASKFEIYEKIHGYLEDLDENERDVINRLYFEGQTMTDIVKATGLAWQTIQGRHDNALVKLKMLIPDEESFI